MEENPYKSPKLSKNLTVHSRSVPAWSIAAIVVAVLGNIVAALIPVRTLMAMPTGSSGRLMVEAAIVLLVVLATLLIVLVVVIVGWPRERSRIAAILAICLALTPIFLSRWVINEVAAMRSIHLQE